MTTTPERPPTALALWRLARPAGLPLVLALPLVGYGFAHWDWALDDRHPAALVAVLASWTLLSAGTLWLNAGLDRDEGEVLMGTSVAPPDHVERWAAAALLGSVATAGLAGVVPGLLAGLCAALAALYSSPATAWKGRPVLGPLVNVVGYGLVSPLAGWWVADVPPSSRACVTWGLLAIWVAATYFGAQAFQEEEDRRRGYRTLVATHGSRAAIAVTRALYAVAFVGLLAMAAVGLYPRLLALALPAWWALDRGLADWHRHPELGARGGRAMLRRATALAAVVVALATVEHVWHLVHGLPPAGLGTAWVPVPLVASR